MVNAEEMLSQLQQVARGMVRKAGHRDEAADEATAYIMAKIAEVLAEFESGARPRPDSMAGYLYRVAERALADWQRQLEEASPLTEGERTWMENALRPLGGFQAFRPKIGLPPPRAKRRPFLLSLLDRATSSLHYDFEDDHESHDGLRRGRGRAGPTEIAAHCAIHDVSCWSERAACRSLPLEEWSTAQTCLACPISQPWRVAERLEQRLAQLPPRDGEGARLYLAGIREAEIARRLGIKPPSVTELLGRVCQKWGADRQGLEVERMRLLFANLFMVMETALRPFRPRDDEGEEDLPEWRPSQEQHIRALIGGPKRPAPDQLQVEWRLAREGAAYKAITSCRALTAWIGGLELDHMPEVIAIVEDCYHPEVSAA